jgi:hypothetical protein
MRTYQARFDVDYSLRILRCLPAGDRIADDRYAALSFEDSIHLLRLLQHAGMPEQIALDDNAKTTWTVTFQQLSVLGYTGAQLKTLDILPDSGHL